MAATIKVNKLQANLILTIKIINFLRNIAMITMKRYVLQETKQLRVVCTNISYICVYTLFEVRMNLTRKIHF